MTKKDIMGLCIYYDCPSLSHEKIHEIVLHVARKFSDSYRKNVFNVVHMYSIDCAVLVAKNIGDIVGVYHVDVDYKTKKMNISYDDREISFAFIKDAMIKLGYDVSTKNRYVFWLHNNRELLLSLSTGILGLLAWVFMYESYSIISLLCVMLAYLTGLFYTLPHSISAILKRELDIDVLMVFSAIGAALLGHTFEGILLLFLFSLGHSLEHKALDKARQAVNDLGKIAPKTAILQSSTGKQDVVSVSCLQVGDNVFVKPNERLPCDGIIVSGCSVVNQSHITGESIPILKQKDDDVFAGSINGQGFIVVKVTKLNTETVINKMVKMILESDAQKTKTQNFTEKFEKIFVPIVIGSVTIAIVIPPLLLQVPLAHAFYNAMLLLVASSPCALAIGTPITVLSAVARCAKMGVLVKGGIQLEQLAHVSVLALDKTGTITLGEPHVQKIIPTGTFTSEELLYYAASLEQYSKHPIALALVHEADARQLKLDKAETVSELIGKGVAGKVVDKMIVVGNAGFTMNLSKQQIELYQKLENEGHTAIAVSIDGIVAGFIAISDMTRTGIADFVTLLQRQGIKTTMLTGDNAVVARKVGAEVGIDDVHSSLMPQDKAQYISAIAKTETVIMLGDGVNDAPAMANSSVGIAMGGAGSDVAMQAADIVLMNDDIAKLPTIISLSKHMSSIIKQNISLALLSIVMLVSSTFMLDMDLSVAIFLHEFTTVLVALNGLRIFRVKL